MIKVSDIVFHKLSGLFFRCENKKQEKWMNENHYYEPTTVQVPESYFKKL